MEELKETLLTISAVCGAIVTIIGFLSVIFKLPAKWVKKATSEHVNALIDEKLTPHKESFETQLNDIKTLLSNLSIDFEADREATRAALRHSITYIYQKYLPNKCLPANVKKDLCSLYEAYQGLNGNSYIHEIYEEMMKWNVK